MTIFTQSNWEEEVLKADLPVLVDFYADWCGPCKMMTPVVEALASELEGQVKIGKINTESDPATAESYKVMSIPTFILFKNGTPIKRIEGAMSREALLEVIKSS